VSRAQQCVPANKGTYVASEAQSAPTPCPVGTYQPETGSTSCLNAPAGY
jgi:hypothetical protein